MKAFFPRDCLAVRRKIDVTELANAVGGVQYLTHGRPLGRCNAADGECKKRTEQERSATGHDRATSARAPNVHAQEVLAMLFDDDLVVLAGGTGRVGGATLAALHRQGARVVVVSRSAESAAKLAEGVERAWPAVADLADPVSTAKLVDETAARYGRIDAVVNLAGRGKFVALTDSTLEDLRINLDGFVVPAYNLAIAALRHMLAQEYRPGRRSRGHIVTVTAGSSKDPQPSFGLFGAAKAAVNTLMRAIAQEHKADGIVANAVVLGSVATEAARSYLNAQDFAAAASPEEVARVLAFLASAESDGINGELVDLNARETE